MRSQLFLNSIHLQYKIKHLKILGHWFVRTPKSVACTFHTTFTRIGETGLWRIKHWIRHFFLQQQLVLTSCKHVGQATGFGEAQFKKIYVCKSILLLKIGTFTHAHIPAVHLVQGEGMYLYSSYSFYIPIKHSTKY